MSRRWGTLGNDEIEKIVSKGYDSVPEKMKEYIETVERLVGKKISIVFGITYVAVGAAMAAAGVYIYFRKTNFHIHIISHYLERSGIEFISIFRCNIHCPEI